MQIINFQPFIFIFKFSFLFFLNLFTCIAKSFIAFPYKKQFLFEEWACKSQKKKNLYSLFKYSQSFFIAKHEGYFKGSGLI